MKRRVRSRLCRLLAAACLLVAGVVAVPAAAQASTPFCQRIQNSDGDNFANCIWDGPQADTIMFEVDQNSDGSVTASVTGTSDSADNWWGTVYLLQCRGDGSNCARVAANTDSATSVNLLTVPTSIPAYSFGHIYEACGSAKDTTLGWTSVLNVCSWALAN